MKKNFLIITLFVMASTVTINCSKKKEAENCNDLISKVNAAEITYAVNQSAANCQAYKTALNNLLGCSIITAAERTAYQQLFDQLTC